LGTNFPVSFFPESFFFSGHFSPMFFVIFCLIDNQANIFNEFM
jgi:hypothetical protein